MFKAYGDYNFQDNQLLNVVLQRLVADPSGTEGKIYYNTASDSIRYHDGTKWRDISSSSSNLAAGDGMHIDVDQTNPDSTRYTLNVNVNEAHLIIQPDGATGDTMVSIKNGAIVEALLADGAVSTAKIKDGNITTVKIADNAITFAKLQDIPTMTIIGNMSAATTDPSAIKVLASLNGLSTETKELATAYSIKAYIDSTIANIGTLKGSWDASTGIFPGTASTKAGDYWYVTVGGVADGVTYNMGDMIIANVNAAGNLANQYISLESNRDKATNTVMGLVKIASPTEILTAIAIGEDKVVTVNTLITRTATETRTGLVELATQAEAEALVDATRALTPKTGADLFRKMIGTSKFSASFGDGTSSYVVTHNLNNLVPQVTFYDSVTKEMIFCPFTITDANKLTFTATPAPTTTTKITIAIA